MKWKVIVCGAMLSVALAAPAQAASIEGTLNLTGTVEVSLTEIDWIPLGGGDGVVLSVQPGSGYFAGIFNPAVVPAYSADSLDLGAGTVLPLDDFLNDFTAPGYAGLSFTLEQIVAPVAPACTGAEAVDVSCSFGVFTLTQRATGVDVSMGVLGYFIDLAFGDDGSGNTAEGTYTTQLNQVDRDTVGEIMGIILGGGSIQSSFSATYIATAVPEPVTLALLGVGMVGLGWRARRRPRG